MPLRDDVQPGAHRRRAARRLPRAGRARGVGRRQAEAARHPLRRARPRARQARRAGVPRDGDEVRRQLGRRPPARRQSKATWAPEARDVARGRVVRADRAAEGAPGDGAARTAGARCAGRVGRCSTTPSSRRNTWRPTSPKKSRARCWRRTRRCAPSSTRSCKDPRVREEPAGAPGVLRTPACVVGRALQPVSGAARRYALAADSVPLEVWISRRVSPPRHGGRAEVAALARSDRLAQYSRYCVGECGSCSVGCPSSRKEPIA